MGWRKVSLAFAIGSICKACCGGIVIKVCLIRCSGFRGRCLSLFNRAIFANMAEFLAEVTAWLRFLGTLKASVSRAMAVATIQWHLGPGGEHTRWVRPIIA